MINTGKRNFEGQDQYMKENCYRRYGLFDEYK